LGFRKPNVPENFELVVDAGSLTNFVALSMGATVNMTNFSPSQLTDAFPDGYGNLQWSAFAAFPPPITGQTNWVTPVGAFPNATLWYTLPGTSVDTQTTPPARLKYSKQNGTQTYLNSVGYGAAAIAGEIGTTNADNNSVLVREPESLDPNNLLSTQIEDPSTPSKGDFNGELGFSVENVTPATFSSAERSDFYQSCPLGYTDPSNGKTNGSAVFLGYFILNTDGTMTFTRASTNAVVPPPPTIGSVFRSGGNLVINGGNGQANAQYRVLSSSDLSIPSTNWGVVFTGTFSASGTYSFTNSLATAPAAYFRIVSP
jgi:hypothetical protein